MRRPEFARLFESLARHFAKFAPAHVLQYASNAGKSRWTDAAEPAGIVNCAAAAGVYRMGGEPEPRVILVREANPLKVLVIGKGGREHAICWKLKQSARVASVFCAPGNAGTALDVQNVAIEPGDFRGLIQFAKREGIGLTVVGPGGAARQGDRRRFSTRRLANLRTAQGSRRARGEQGLRQGAHAAGGDTDGRLPGFPLGARRGAFMSFRARSP